MASQNEAERNLALARKHLERVQDSWDPVDWLDLAIYGLWCLEAAVVAAAAHLGWEPPRQHWTKVDAAERLEEEHDFESTAPLLADLNELRKAEAYGDVPPPENMDAEEVASTIESYVEAVATLIEGEGS